MPKQPLVQVPPINNTSNSATNQAPPVSVPNHVTKPSTTNLPINNHKAPVVEQKPAPSLPPQSIAPTTIPQAPKPVALPSPDKPKPNVLSPLPSTYTDPIEQSLANLEHDIKTESIPNPLMIPPMMNNTLPPNLNCNPLNQAMLQPNSMEVKPPIMSMGNLIPPNMLHGLHPMEHDLPNIPTNMMHTNNNGFDMKPDFDMNSQNNNGLSSVGLPMNMSIPSMFDPLPVMNNIPPPMKKDAPLIQAKPIEELTDPVQNMMDKKLTPPEHKHSQQAQFNYAKAKQDQNVKNASSWSSLASSSPQNSAPGSGAHSKQHVMDSFKAFQTKAKEKADREKQRLENLELKRQQKEMAEKERMRVEIERRREREEEDALEKARYVLIANHKCITKLRKILFLL